MSWLYLTGFLVALGVSIGSAVWAVREEDLAWVPKREPRLGVVSGCLLLVLSLLAAAGAFILIVLAIVELRN